MATRASPTWVWTSAGFVPMDDAARAVAGRYKPGDFANMKPVKIRNPKFHRKAFALLNYVATATGFASETIRQYGTVKAGYFDTVELPHLKYRKHSAMSWAFDNMDDEEFYEFFEAFLKVMLEDFVPQVPEAELRAALERELVNA